MEAAPTTRAERHSRNSPLAAPGDNAVRFSMRSLLWVTTCVAVVLAVAAPYVREFGVEQWVSLCYLWGAIVVATGAGTWWFRRKAERFARRTDSARLLKVVPKHDYWIIGIVYAAVIGLLMSLLLVGLRIHGGVPRFMAVIFGLQVAVPLPFIFAQTRLWVELTEAGIVSPLSTTPWRRVRGLSQGSGENLLRLRMRPEFQLYVLPERREEVLRVIEQHTGHTLQEPLEEYLENYQSSRGSDAD